MTRGATSSFGLRVLLLVAVALAAAVALSPAVAWGIDAVRDASPETARSLGIRDAGDGWDFGRVFRRLAMASALVCGFLLRRRLPRVRARGIGRGDRRAFFLVSGLAFGVLSFAAFLAGLVVLGRLTIDPAPAAAWPLTLLEAAAVGLLVGTIEEWAVRGWFQEGLAGRRGLAFAVVVTSAVYSILHYFRAGVPVDGASWDVGLAALGAHAVAMTSPAILPSAAGLMLVGASLGYAYAWSRSLPFAIGVHAGWVAVLKSGELMFDRRLSLGWLWGEDGVLGTPWAWLWLAATIVAVRWWLRRPMTPRALFVAIVALGLVGCGQIPEPESTQDLRTTADIPVFVDVTAAVGVDFVHEAGNTEARFLCEIMGPGAGLFDHDGDGDLDLYLVQGYRIAPGGGPLPDPGGRYRDRLYRNDLRVEADGTRTLRFTDVTEASGIDARGYGMGVAAADYDGDGDVDLYVTNFGPNQLWRNRGDGTFEDVTAAAGAGDDRFSVSAAFVDVDGDGLLDLYVGNYVDLTWANNRICENRVPDYCSPSAYRPVPDRLLRNRGDGTFEDVTAAAGLTSAYGNGLGVVTGDFDGDGRADLFVANDGTANQLWTNRGGGRFEDTALLAGCAFNDMGEAEAGMGVTAADVDDDGDEDLLLTHLRGETHTLYVGDGRGSFSDDTLRTRLAAASRADTGFGTSWIDFDNDGDLDLLAVNGAVTVEDALLDEGDPYPYHQPDRLFENVASAPGELTFEERPGWEDDPGRSEVGRGAAFGDLDDDGDVDVVVANNEGPARVLLNRAADFPPNGWIGLRAVHRPRPDGPVTDALGAWVEVERADGVRKGRRVRTDGSYASANDPRVVVGLGADPGGRPVTVRVRWPGGSTERWSGVAPGRWHTLERGTGETEGP